MDNLRLGRLPLLLLVLAISACTRPTGDFGRAQPGMLHDELMPKAGELRARGAGEPVSNFNFTDQETEMRDRVWRYLVAAHAYDWWGDAETELQRTRLIPPRTKPRPVNAYYDWLHGARFASSRVRFNRLAEDVRLDTQMMQPTFRAICAVLEVDRQRRAALDNIGTATGPDVEARRLENKAIIDWFVRSATERYEAYNYALDHLLVETPHQEAVTANAELNLLAPYIEAAQRGDFCAGPVSGQQAGSGGLTSRYLHSNNEPTYRK